MKKQYRFSIILTSPDDEKLEEKTREYAYKNKISINEVVRRALKDYFKKK